MISSSGATGLLRQAPSEPAAPRALFVSVLLLMLSTGWVANHFVALMPLISDRQHLSATTLDGIFGIYALGLIPGLLVGGRVSDALGRPSVALVGSATSLVGTSAMLASQHADALLVGRLIVGVGVGLAMTSCTAWASDLNGPAGAATAGAVLIAGFAVGPFAGGLIARAGQAGVAASFGVAAALVVGAIGVTLAALRRADVSAPATGPVPQRSTPARQGTAWALGWAMPLAPWVFASATLGFVTIPTRLHTGLTAPMAAGTATLIVNGVSGVIQVIARAANWGRHAGTAGALLAALGYAVTALAPPTMTPALGLPLFLVLGCASGLCLRAGLIDLETAAPQRLRGALVGVFYVVTYVGFGLPLILATVGATASAAILAVMSVLALSAALSRAVRLSREGQRQKRSRLKTPAW
ncbi:MFS transporter [Mycobacterium palustre]|uniref:MFS transporter n=1 Tax=Mycobacterium palustre TaxID=153971 RepID=A0A1X1Z5U2_9MYCO|nr:MFS transporter [Mycobacterium palustre]MCV7103299.1 MFS transporter [Mycobacterium palustre]ORW18674.1 MFS transporter [Mycobacterium palustre]